MFRKTTVAALGLMLVAIPGRSEIQAQDTMEWSNRMTQGQVLEVKGIVGEIHAVLASGDEAEVVARKRGSRGDFEEVAIEVEQVDDGFIICAVYGTWNHGEGHCLPNHRDRDNEEGGRHRNNSIDVEVEYEVRVPAGVEFQGHMVSGGIEVEDLRSEVEVNTVNGNIFVSTSEMAWANTVSGNIEIEMGDFGSEELEFNTVSGDITLWLPADFDADIRFSSLSGELDSDFDLNIQNRRERRWIGSDIRAKIGDGGRDLYFHTISGDVSLRRK